MDRITQQVTRLIRGSQSAAGLKQPGLSILNLLFVSTMRPSVLSLAGYPGLDIKWSLCTTTKKNNSPDSCVFLHAPGIPGCFSMLSKTEHANAKLTMSAPGLSSKQTGLRWWVRQGPVALHRSDIEYSPPLLWTNSVDAVQFPSLYVYVTHKSYCYKLVISCDYYHIIPEMLEPILGYLIYRWMTLQAVI